MRQVIESCFEDAIGAGGIDRASFDAVLARSAPSLERLKDEVGAAARPHFSLPFRDDDLEGVRALAGHLGRNASDVVFCGTGGSSLGGQALAQVAGRFACAQSLQSVPRLHFADNLDAEGFAALTRLIATATPYFVIISKSGTTAETLAQTLAILGAFRARGLEGEIAERVCVLTEAGPGSGNGLRALAARFGLAALDHLPDLGGRFSVFSNVGMLPALLAGLDPDEVRAGAAQVLRALQGAHVPGDCAPAVGAALQVALWAHRGAATSVLFAYGDRLERLARWHVQLWAESLGKEGRGTTPIAALGPVDQHSQLQLFLDGPRDKVFTVLMAPQAGQGPLLDGDLAREAGAPYLADKLIGDLVAAMQEATAATLAASGRPVRTLRLDSIGAESAGQVMMHFMLETMFAADLFGVDPFGQPAVEAGKALARGNLAAL